METTYQATFGELQFNPPTLTMPHLGFGQGILSCCYLMAIMCFPGCGNESLRKKATAILYGSFMTQYFPEGCDDTLQEMHDPIDINFVKTLILPPPMDINALTDSLIESQKEGSIAGEIIHNIFCMDQINISQPSYYKARAFIQYDIEKQNVNISHSDSTIDRCWSKYKNVSHLWAAMQYLETDKYRGGPPPITELIDERNVVMLLSVAERFRIFGEKYVTHNTNMNSLRTLFAKGEAWRPAPNFPLCHVEWEIWGEGGKIIPDLEEKLTYFKNKRKSVK